MKDIERIFGIQERKDFRGKNCYFYIDDEWKYFVNFYFENNIVTRIKYGDFY